MVILYLGITADQQLLNSKSLLHKFKILTIIINQIIAFYYPWVQSDLICGILSPQKLQVIQNKIIEILYCKDYYSSQKLYIESELINVRYFSIHLTAYIRTKQTKV